MCYRMILSFLSILLFFGCEYANREKSIPPPVEDFAPVVEEYEGSPHAAYILSISESRPAEVTIGWTFYARDGCTGASGVAAERDGNIIYLTIKVSHIFEVHLVCTQAVEERTGQFTVENLEAGEYIIKGKDENAGVLGRFSIQSSFAGRTENYEMLGVKASKDWLSENGFPVREIDDDTLLINEVIRVSKGSRYLISVKGGTIIEDDEGNIRVGFFREN